MNYLGHFHLATPSAALIVGNLLGEYVHGNAARDLYPDDVWEGVMMHRYIDSYTDAHKSAKELAQFFRADFKRYAPVMSDIAVDYLLASDMSRYPTVSSLHDFALNIYDTLKNYAPELPADVQHVIAEMAKHDWLTQYRQYAGIGKAFGYVISRSTYLSPKPSPYRAIDILRDNEQAMRPFYTQLITDLEKEFLTSSESRKS